jgi:hypothetical protein
MIYFPGRKYKDYKRVRNNATTKKRKKEIGARCKPVIYVRICTFYNKVMISDECPYFKWIFTVCYYQVDQML